MVTKESPTVSESKERLLARLTLQQPGIYRWTAPPKESETSIDCLFEKLQERISKDEVSSYFFLIDLKKCEPPPQPLLNYIQAGFLSLSIPPSFVAFVTGKNIIINAAAKYATEPVLGKKVSFYKTVNQALIALSELRVGSSPSVKWLFKKFLKNQTNTLIYGLIGILLGMLFPLSATVILMVERGVGFWEAHFHSGSLIWIIDLAPLVLGAVFTILGKKEGRLQKTAQLEFSALLLDASQEGIFGLDLEGKTTFVNPAVEKMLGYGRREMLGKSMHALIHHSHPDGSPYNRETCPMDAAFNKGTIHHVTDEVLWRKDGTSFPVEYKSTPILKNNVVIGAVVTFGDISKMKLEKDKREQGELYYKQLVNNSPDYLFKSRIKDFRITEVNDRACEKYGYTREEFLELDIFDLEVNPPLKEQIQELYNSTPIGQVIEIFGTNKKKDGSTFPVNVRFAKIDEEFALANVRDISDQLIKEDKIKRLASIVETAGVAVTSVDLKGMITGWNKTAEKLFEYSEDEMLGMPIKTIIPDDKLEETKWMLEKGWSGQSVNIETVRTAKSGARVPIDLTLSPMRDKLGRVSGVSGIILPIGEKLKLQKIYKEQLAQLDFAALVSYTDKAGIITYANDLFCKVSQYSSIELIGKPHSIVNSGYHPKEFWEGMWSTLKNGLTWKAIVKNKAKDGSDYWVQSTMMPRTNEKGDIIGYASVRVDITAQKEAEQQLIHSSKLASIGELAAGVGHEINNPLAIANGNVEKIKKELKKSGFENELITRSLAKYKTASGRITNIVQGLRTFARADTDHTGPFELTELVKQSFSLLEDIYRKDGIEIITKIPSRHIHIMGNAGRLQQALTNLFSNARDALETIENPKITIGVEPFKTHVNITVSDNGPGIPKNLRKKIFNNFFTTKDLGKGTGMGLTLTANIIKEHLGALKLESTLGSGTTFIIDLPLADIDEVIGQKQISQNSPIEKPLPSKVLIVDDEEGIREILRDELQDLGCTVEEAPNGKLALEKIKNQDFDHIFTDMKMPEMDGKTLLEEIHKLKKSPRPLLFVVTGGVNIDFSDKGGNEISQLVDGYLYKPFNDGEIAKLLITKKPTKPAIS